MTEPRFEPPNDAERRWIATHLAKAAELAVKYGGDPAGSTRASLAALDQVWTALGPGIRSAGADPNGFINIIGLALGQHLADDRGLEWSVVTDEYGTDMAVRCPTTGAQVVPTNLVAKRWASATPAFLQQVARQIAADIEIVQTAAGMFDEE